MATVATCSSPRSPRTESPQVHGRSSVGALPANAADPFVLKMPDADAFRPDPAVEVVTPFEDTHFGSREMTFRDPDGRLWSLQAPAKN